MPIAATAAASNMAFQEQGGYELSLHQPGGCDQHLIVRVGGFHIALNFLSVIGKGFEKVG